MSREWRVLDGPDLTALSESPLVSTLSSIGVAQELRLPLAALLARRGISSPEVAQRFLDPGDRTLHDPRLLPDAPGLIARLKAAGDAGEPVLVVGDFDADGLTGAAIIIRALREVGAIAESYIPQRAADGHGIPEGAIVAALEDGVELLLAVDCGTGDVAQVRAARDQGIAVGIIDHHAVPPQPAPANWLVNPNRSGATYPFPHLAGSGLAFKIAQGLLEEHPRRREILAELSVLAMIGGVADMVPVADEFRVIVRSALRVLNGAANTPSGVTALLARAGAEGPHRVDVVGFTLAPRINAAGRIGDAGPALELLTADDLLEATQLAEALEQVNEQRKEVTRDALADARRLLGLSGDPFDGARAILADGLVAVRGPWSPGVLGLVAGRLAEEFGRPALVAHESGDDGEEGGVMLRASIRAPRGYAVATALQENSTHFLRHGGHDGAGGCSLPAPSWLVATAALGASFATQQAAHAPYLDVDLELPSGFRSVELLAALVDLLAPTGVGNADPLFLLRGVTLIDVRLVGDGRHARIKIDLDGRAVEGIAFGRADVDELAGQAIDLVVRVLQRTYRGQAKVELQVVDVRPAIVTA